uniref:uncharacterized protein C4orf50 homolog isoform X2 n=1 Tax=Jaculus jaculus TaxID=51337 RepID=UPI001E1B2823|nr:uncharacterized protein C4orf50 homolog isoform X2 [Jaculus jaculus]
MLGIPGCGGERRGAGLCPARSSQHPRCGRRAAQGAAGILRGAEAIGGCGQVHDVGVRAEEQGAGAAAVGEETSPEGGPAEHPRSPGTTHLTPRSGAAAGPEGGAGQPDRLSKGLCNSTGDGPCNTSGTTGELRGVAGSEHGQGESSQDGQVLLPRGCPQGQCMEERLFSLPLVRAPESLTATPVQEPFLLAQKSMLPLWRPAGECEPLLPILLQEPPHQELQTRVAQEGRPQHSPGATACPGWGHYWTRSCDLSPTQVSPNMLNGPFSRNGPKGPRDMWKTRSEGLAAREEERGVRGTLSMMEGEFRDQCQPGQESSENPSLAPGTQTPEGMQEDSGALDTPATACYPWPLPQFPVLSLQGMASGSQEVLESLSRRERVDVCSWGLLSSEEEAVPIALSSRDHRIREPWSNPGQFPAGKGQDILRRAQGKPCFVDGLLLQKEHSGDDGANMERGGVSSLEQPDSKAHTDQGRLFIAREQDVSQFPKWPTASARDEAPLPPGTLSIGQCRHGPQTDQLEREVEVYFWQLSTLKLGGEGCQQVPSLGGESWNLVLPGWGSEEDVCPQQALSSQCPDACSAEDAEPRNGGEGVGLEENMAPDPGRVLPEASPDGDTAGWGSTKLGRSQIFSPWGAERTRDSFHQLLAVLRKERNQLLCDNARLQGDQEKYHREVCLLEKERVREAAETQRLEQMNCTLQGELGRIRQELHQCLQTLSALEDCNGRSYGRISELEEENERLKADLQQLQTALSESVRQDRGGMEHVAVENRELRALISEVGVSYKELIKDTVLSIGDMVQALQEENRHLLCRVQGLEQEVTLQINKDRESWGEGQHPQEDTKMAGDKGCTADKEVQVTTPLERLISTASGPPLDEEAGLVGGQREPSSDLDSRCRADATSLSLAQREAGIPQDLQEHTNAGGKASRLKPENKPQPRNFLEPAQALRSLSHGPQLQDGEARATEEDASLCVQRLRHQVRTLQCQLRDQGSALWQLQAARDKAVGLQDELKGKLEELREQQHEARLAMSPLKAKLASLVRKCQERNHLIMHLLWEMQRHGFGNLLLSRWAQNMLNDVALAEYAATFLGPGAPETSYKLDMGPEETAARGAQEYLVDSEVDNAMQSPLVASWPLPEVEGTAWATWLDSLKDRRQSGQAYATGKGECPSQVTNGTSGQ